MFKKSGTKVPRNKTIKKPKFILVFLKCLAICLVVSLFASYRYLLYIRKADTETCNDAIETNMNNAIRLALMGHDSSTLLYQDAQLDSMESMLYAFSWVHDVYCAYYENNEKILETEPGYYCSIGLSLNDYEYFMLEDGSYLETLETYKDGKYDLKESYKLRQKYSLDWDMAERFTRAGLLSPTYTIEFENVYLNMQTHRFIPGKARILDWITDEVVDEIDLTPADTKGYRSLVLGENCLSAMYGYLDPEKVGQNIGYYTSMFGDVVTVKPGITHAEWYIGMGYCDPSGLSFSEFYPLTLKVVILAAVLLSILVALIISVIRYQRKKTIWAIFDYRKKTTEAMAHDLKTPLAAISAYAECLEESPDQAPEYSSKIRENVTEMNQMLERILHFSRSEGRQSTGAKSTVNLDTLVRETLEKYSALFSKNQVTTSIENGEGKESVVITTDEDLMRQVIENLLSNCAKYAEPGSEVKIGISDAEVSFRNRTTMTDVDVENLKKPFVKGESSRGENGTGLGLAIADNNLKMLGYALQLALQDGWFESKVILK